MKEEKFDTEKLAMQIATKLSAKCSKCDSLEDYLELAYSFSYDKYTIAPTQKKNEIKRLLQFVSEEKPENILEIGTSNGGTLFLLCKIASPHATILSIDKPDGPFGGQLYPNWKIPLYKSFASYRQKIHLIRRDSHDTDTIKQVNSILGGKKFDFILIDGDHTFDGIKKDFEMYSPLVKEDGIIAIHDINEGPKEQVGDVPRFWRKIKKLNLTAEIIDPDEIESYGIGLVFPVISKSNSVNFNVYKKILELKDEYLDKLNKKILLKNTALERNPLGLLLSIHSRRLDLVNAFPEVSSGNYKRLVEWAISIIDNKNEYEEEPKLRLTKYRHQYEELLSTYQNSDELQKVKLERDVINKELERLTLETSELKRRVYDLSNTIEAIRNSVSFKIIGGITSRLDRLLPDSSIRGKIKRKLISNIHKPSNTPLQNLVYHIPIKDPQYTQKEISSFKWGPKISILMPVYNVPVKYLQQAIKSVQNQIYENWELCICDDKSTKKEIHELLKKISSEDERIKVIFSESNEGIAKATNKALSLATGDFVMLLDHDDKIAANACYEIVKLLNRDNELDFIYTDEDKIDELNRHSQPFYKPDWSPDLLLSINYVIHCCVFRRSILSQIGGFREGLEGSQDYDLILRYTEKITKIGHIPKILYHWRTIRGSSAKTEYAKPYAYDSGMKAINEALKRRGLDGKCLNGLHQGTYRVKYSIKGEPLVSIIIPSIRIKNLKKCIESIFTKSTYKKFEIIVIDGSQTNEISNFTQKFPNTYRFKSPVSKFNFSKINNFGVSKSKGEYIIFLNDDTEVIEPNWIEELLGHAQRKEVGMVGAKLLYPDNKVQHAGTIIGMRGHAGNYGGMPNNDPHYFALHLMIRDVSAVTAACMMISRELFDLVGGFDEELGRAWQDVDLCLRVLRHKRYIVYTPFSLLYHFEGGTRGRSDPSQEELEARSMFRKKHILAIQSGDPYYNPNLSTLDPYVEDIRYTVVSDPLEILLKLYNNRLELQLAFPEVKNGEYQKLIDWAGF